MSRDSSGADLLSQDSAFFSIFVAEWFMMMLKNPNKPTDLVFCTLAQKYFILIVLVIVHFVASYDWISIAAVIFVGTLLHFILNHRGVEVLNPLTALIEKALTCGRSCNCSAMGFVTAEQGRQNAKESSDHLIAFDRRTIRGSVRQNPWYRQQVAEEQKAQQSSPFTSSSTSASSSGGGT